MINISKWSLLVLLLFSGIAYPQQYFIKSYTIEDSLPTRFVLDVTQDKHGMMWFATYSGVSNYDGFSFANYTSKDGLADQNYRQLEFDANGVLWALPFYANDTLCYFKDNKWYKIINIKDSISKHETTCFSVFLKDGKTSICIGTTNGFIAYENNEWKSYKFSNSVYENLVTDISVYNDKFLLSGVFGFCEYKNGELDFSLNDKLGKYKDIKSFTFVKKEDKVSEIWVLGPEWIGVLKENVFEVVIQGLEMPTQQYHSHSYLTFDKVGNLIFGNGWGKYCLVKDTKEIKPLHIKNGFSSNGATSVYKDREDNIWFADTRGIDKINNLDLKNYFELNGLLENEVTAITELRGGGFVFGHNSGLTVYKDSKFKRIPFKYANVNSTRVLDMIQDRDGYVWFTANENGVGRLDDEGNIKWFFEKKDFLVSSIYQDKNGRIWFGAMNKLYFIENGEVKLFEFSDKINNTFRKIFECESGGFYVAGVNGLWLVNGNRIEKIPCEDSKPLNVYSYLKTKSGDELVGTLNGLYKIENGKIVKFNKNGFSCDRPIYFILEDYRGHFWFGSNDGAYHWEGNKEVLKYSPRNGLSGYETNRSAGIIDSEGKVWIGTDKGLTSFAKTYTDYKISVPMVEFLNLEDSKGNFYDLKDDNSIIYINNSLQFNFRAMSYVNEDMITYEYMLEGFDTEWIRVKQAMIDAVRYINIPPGDYKFKVRARNFSGDWSGVLESGDITIHSPFYKSVWFIVIILLLFSSMVFSLLKIKFQRENNRKLKQEISIRKQIEEDLLESKQKYKDIVDLLPEAIYETDLNGNFTYVNNYGLNLFKYTADDIRNGISAYKVIDKSFLDVLEKNRERVINKEVVTRVEYVGVTKDGIKIPVSVNATPIYKDGKVVGIRGVAADMTEQKRNEEVLRKFARDMESLNASKDKFFSIVAHDLKNPFQGLLGFSDFLHNEYDTLNEDEKKEYIGYIRLTSKNAYALLENLLQWSRLQTGRIEVKTERINAFNEVNSVGDLLTANMIRKKISFKNEVDKDIYVIADRNMFVSILQNIITNAIKFTNQGGNIYINSKIENGDIKLSITDNGVGIKPEYLEKIFRIDHDTTSTGTMNETGTGLGLLLTKEMVELNGGKIFVESEVGKGSTFSVILPPA